MKERLITLACALGALALFLTMFMRGEEGPTGRRDVPRPTSEERRGNGYHAAMTWLYRERIRTASLRERFDKLPADQTLPRQGNLLIVTLPAAAGFRNEELRSLAGWIRGGNTLLVLASLADNPDWAFALGGFASGDLNLLTGLEFEPRGTDKTNKKSGEGASRINAAARAFVQPRRGTLVPNRPHVYFDGVERAVALSDYPAQSWTVKVPYDGFVLSLGHSRETGEGVLWTRPLGEGRVIVSGFGSLFTNRALGLEGNARLLANIVGATLGPRGAVVFDDVHQGLGATYDPTKFYQDPRLYATVGILAALWLIWVLGSTRLRMPEARTQAPREIELVRATGGFLARVLRPDAGARRMLEHFFRRVEERAPRSRSQDGPPWDFLERHPHVAREDIGQLKAWYSDARASRRVPLTRLHNLIARIDRHLRTI